MRTHGTHCTKSAHVFLYMLKEHTTMSEKKKATFLHMVDLRGTKPKRLISVPFAVDTVLCPWPLLEFLKTWLWFLPWLQIYLVFF